MNAATRVIHSPVTMSGADPTRAPTATPGSEERARQRLLRAGTYAAPRVIGTVSMVAACAGVSCGPNGGPCGPDSCGPNGGCGPTACMPGG